MKPDIATGAVTKTFLAIATLPVWDIALAVPFGWGIGDISGSVLTFTTALPIPFLLVVVFAAVAFTVEWLPAAVVFVDRLPTRSFNVEILFFQ